MGILPKHAFYSACYHVKQTRQQCRYADCQLIAVNRNSIASQTLDLFLSKSYHRKVTNGIHQSSSNRDFQTVTSLRHGFPRPLSRRCCGPSKQYNHTLAGICKCLCQPLLNIHSTLIALDHSHTHPDHSIHSSTSSGQSIYLVVCYFGFL